MDLILVHGSPCSGKTTYVKSQMQEGDVIIDADLLAQALGSPDSHAHPGHIKALGAKLRDVATHEASRGDYTAWIVSCSPRATSLIPHTSSIPIDPGIDVCLSRAKGRPHWTKEAIREYYDKREIPNPANRKARIEW